MSEDYPFRIPRRKPIYKGYIESSQYITVRDGIKIAAEIWLPKGLSSSKKIPTVLVQTRYWRAILLKPIIRLFRKPAFEPKEVKILTSYGFAVVCIDVRGCGASYGDRLGPFSEDEVKDGSDIVDWIINQPWSDGNVVSNGISYTGFTAEWLATNNHPAVKSVMPGHNGWDSYVDMILPGGCFNTAFIQLWSFYGKQLDQNVQKQMKILIPFRWMLMKGVKYGDY